MAKKRNRRSSNNKPRPRQRPRHSFSSATNEEMASSSSSTFSKKNVLVVQDELHKACSGRRINVMDGPQRRSRSDNRCGSLEAEGDETEEEQDGHTDPLSDALFALANAAEIDYRVVNLPRRHQHVPHPPPSRSEDAQRSRKAAPERRHNAKTDPDGVQQGYDSCGSTTIGEDNGKIPQERIPELFMLRIRQDASACGKHTGGIVWETCYLLLEYLQHTKPAPHTTLGRCLEVGAGCGLLGQVLWYRGQCQCMVLTETDLVLDNLRANVQRNQRPQQPQPNLDNDRHPSLSDRATSGGLHCCRLDWTEPVQVQQQATTEQDAQGLLQEPFDTIVGTDVVFAPHLVDPLLRTMRTLSHHRTVAYLCVQIRCAASHALLLERASIYGWTIVDRTPDLPTIPSCAWGAELECHLLQLISTGTRTHPADLVVE